MPNTFTRSQIVRLSKEYSDPNFRFPVGTRGRVIHRNEQTGLWKISIEDPKFSKASGHLIYVGSRSLAVSKRGRQSEMLAETETAPMKPADRIKAGRRKLAKAIAGGAKRGVKVSPINWKLMIEDADHKHSRVVGEGRMTGRMLAAFGVTPPSTPEPSANGPATPSAENF